MHSEIVLENPNIWTALAATVVSVLITYIIGRITKRGEAAREANDEEIRVRAKFISDLARRVTELEQAIDAASTRERELTRNHQRDYDNQERRWRHAMGNLVTYVAQLRRRLAYVGASVPAFRGWDQFIRDGGDVPPEWLDATGNNNGD